jgi:hypothetical protein
MRRFPLLRLFGLLGALGGFGCYGESLHETKTPEILHSTFDFQRDTFSFANETVFEYNIPSAKAAPRGRHEPNSDYTLRCFVMARSARQFFQHARFDPKLPVADDATYADLVRRIVATDPREDRPSEPPIVIPGYPNLRALSAAHEKVVKAELGGAWQSFLQRGNWRILLPFSAGQQQATAAELVESLQQNRPPVVHVVTHSLTINHAVLLFGAVLRRETISFAMYDPNDPRAPLHLEFHRPSATFRFPTTAYFPGGPVEVYEVYNSWAF